MSKTTAEKIAVMQAFERGEKIEIEIEGLWKQWNCLSEPDWDWFRNNYRIAPKPKKTVELYQYLVENNGRVYVSNLMNQPPSSGKVLKRLDDTKMVVEVEDSIEQPDEDGWITHSGGECPVSDETVVEVKFRNGVQNPSPKNASFWDWTYENQPLKYDIIAYRIVK